MNDTLIETDKGNLYLSLINQIAKITEVYRLSKETSFDAAISFVKPPIFGKTNLYLYLKQKNGL